VSASTLDELVALQAEYAYEPEKWAYNVCGFEAKDWQASGLRDYIEHQFCAWCTGSGVGKSAMLAIIILHFLATRPFPKIPCTAPSGHQLNDVLWAEIHKWMRRSEMLSKLFKHTATKVGLIGHENEWFAVARTSRPQPGRDTAEGLQGFHADHVLYAVDEGSGVSDQILGAVDGALTTPGSHAIIASNPTRRTGYFYKIMHDEELQRVWATRVISSRDSSFVDPAYIKRIESHYGAESDYCRMRVDGLFPRAESSALVTAEQVYEAHKRVIPDEKIVNEPVVLSLDPARFGDDDSVWMARKGPRLIFREQVHGMDVQEVTTFGIDLIHQLGASEYRIDEIGIGAGVVDHSKHMLKKEKVRVIGVHVGERALDEERFFNLRAEIFWNVRNVINYASIPIETDRFDEEITRIYYGWDSKDKKIRVEKKDEIKRKLGRSPNDADAFAILYGNLRASTAVVSPTYFMAGSKGDVAERNAQSVRDGGRNDVGTDLLSVGLGLGRESVGANRYKEFRSFDTGSGEF
jgi:hypothetical protein